MYRIIVLNELLLNRAGNLLNSDSRLIKLFPCASVSPSFLPCLISHIFHGLAHNFNSLLALLETFHPANQCSVVQSRLYKRSHASAFPPAYLHGEHRLHIVHVRTALKFPTYSQKAESNRIEQRPFFHNIFFSAVTIHSRMKLESRLVSLLA